MDHADIFKTGRLPLTLSRMWNCDFFMFRFFLT